jgi:uncharacterized protein YlaI
MSKFRCFVCEKKLEEQSSSEETNVAVYGAGYARLSFHYGSRYDQLGGIENPKTPLEKLLNCDIIEMYICDDCFASRVASHKKFFAGYNNAQIECDRTREF